MSTELQKSAKTKKVNKRDGSILNRKASVLNHSKKNRPYLFTFFIILSLGWAIAIFVLSNQTRTKSHSLSMEVTELVIKMMPEEKQLEYKESYKETMKLNVQIRKVTHFALYLIGGIVITIFVTMSKMSTFKIIYLSTIFGVLYAASDELHQFFVENRGAQIKDVLIDSAGFVLGESIIILIYILRKKKLEKRGVNE